MQKIRFKRIQGAQLPTIATEGSGCFDFYVHRVQHVSDNKVILYFGLQCAVPKGYSLILKPRSSFTHKGWVMANSPGEVDSDYRGELQVRFEAIPQEYRESEYTNRGYRHDNTGIFIYPACPYKEGDRCVQAKLEEVIPVEFEEVQTLDVTARAEGGFGSTGK